MNPKEGFHFEVVWDFAEADAANEAHMNTFLETGFEPFAVLPFMTQSLSNPRPVMGTKVYFKKPNMVEKPNEPAPLEPAPNDEIPNNL